MIVAGYIVVRKSEFVGEYFGDNPEVLKKGSDLTCSYAGIDRDCWWDFNSLFYDGRLSAGDIALNAAIESTMSSEFSAGICLDLSGAERVLYLSNKIADKNEIVYVEFFDDYSQIKTQSNSKNWLGFDAYAGGFGSMIRLGIFTKPAAFSEFVEQLTPFGLFSNMESLLGYTGHYECLPELAVLEPMDAGISRQICSVYSV